MEPPIEDPNERAKAERQRERSRERTEGPRKRRAAELRLTFCANEFLATLGQMAGDGTLAYDMSFLKDRNRGLILLLLDKIEASRNPAYVPLLRAWARIDYRKVAERIRGVIKQLEPPNEPGLETR